MSINIVDYVGHEVDHVDDYDDDCDECDDDDDDDDDDDYDDDGGDNDRDSKTVWHVETIYSQLAKHITPKHTIAESEVESNFK